MPMTKREQEEAKERTREAIREWRDAEWAKKQVRQRGYSREARSKLAGYCIHKDHVALDAM